MAYDSDSDVEVMAMDEESEFEDYGAEVSDDDDDDYAMENAAPAAKKKTSKPAAAKKTKKAAAAPSKKNNKTNGSSAAALKTNKNADNMVDDSIDDDDMDFDADDSTKKSSSSTETKTKKTIEQTYQKLTQLEHILKRPDTYSKFLSNMLLLLISSSSYFPSKFWFCFCFCFFLTFFLLLHTVGSIESRSETMFVLDEENEKIVNREITFTPGLYKIFDEIVVNAADNKQRDGNMSEMHIEVNREKNLISVKNNGKGIAVAMHKEHNCYVPTMIFGQLLTGSNFDDDEKRTTGGRNGYGAKLANIFSTEFIVECLDSERGLKFKQIFRDNMKVKEEPIIKNCTASEKKKGDYTKISFKPDLVKFGYVSFMNFFPRFCLLVCIQAQTTHTIIHFLRLPLL